LTIAAASRHLPLLTGGSALAMPLPALYADDGDMPDDAPLFVRPHLPEGAIVLSGSCSAMTHQQVARYQELAPSCRLNPVALATDGLGDAMDFLHAQPPRGNPLFYATAAPAEVRMAQDRLGVAKAGAIVEEALAAIARAAFDAGVRRFVVAGGETSGAVARALGLSRLDVGAEIAPGVPWTFAKVDGQDIAITLKSGNFGDVDFFAMAIERLGP